MHAPIQEIRAKVQFVMHARKVMTGMSNTSRQIAVICGGVLIPWERGHLRDPLQPTAHASRSGAYVLYADPTERFGSGPAFYRLEHNKQVVWQGERPLTILKAVVADDGRVIGNALTEGLIRGGEHVIFAFDEVGAVREIARMPNEPSRKVHGPKVDYVEALAWNTNTDIAIASFEGGVEGKGQRVWSTDSGEPIKVNGEVPRFQNVIPIEHTVNLRAIPGTPLFLVQQRVYEWNVGSGYLWQVVDAHLQPVWKLLRPNDCDGVGLSAQIEDFRSTLVSDRQFEILFARDRAIAIFEAVPEASGMGGWRVEERGRREWAIDPSARQPMPNHAGFMPLDLPLIRDVSLGVGETGADSPVRDIVGWQPLNGGRVEFVRKKSSESQFEFARLGSAGDVLIEQQMPAIPTQADETVKWFPLAEGRWIASRVGFGEHAKGKVWSVDPIGGGAEELHYDGYPLEALAKTPDGGFVILAKATIPYGIETVLQRCDAEGRAIWSKSQTSFAPDSTDPSSLFSPSDVTCLPDGRIVVVENIRNQLQIWTLDGTFETAISLEKAWGREPNYPSSVSCDGRGRLLVYDSGGVPPVWRMDSTWTVESSWQPIGSSGQLLGCWPKCAADGSVWGNEGGSFMRFDVQGNVEFTMGNMPSQLRLVEPSVPVIDGFDRVLMLDQQNGWLFAFDREGHRLFVGKPHPEEHNSRIKLQRILASPSGEVFVASGKGVVHYKENGERVSNIEADGTFAWLPNGEMRWRTSAAVIELVDCENNVIKQIERDADRRFFRTINLRAASPNGRALLLDCSASGKDARLVFVEPEGEVSETRCVPNGLVAFDAALSDHWVALWGTSSACKLLKRSTDTWYSLEVSGAPEGSYWTFGFSRDGAELWATNQIVGKLKRFRLPD